MFKWLKNFFKEKECHHLYWPEYSISTGKPIGQTCALCGKFNSLKGLGLEEPK